MERIKVAIRIRPFLPNENEENIGINMDPDDDKTIIITKDLKSFKGIFDKILSIDSNQKDVFDFIKPCLINIKNCYNCTILTYGQTGSGKTYTMFGGDWSFNNYSISGGVHNLEKNEYNFILNKQLIIDPFSESNGIIPNLIMQLFNTYNKQNNEQNNENEEKNENNSLNITCSYIQIYNEKIYDLLQNIDEVIIKKDFEIIANRKKSEVMLNQNCLKIKYDKMKGLILEGVNEMQTNSFFSLFDILAQGEINRKIRQTNKNEMSSRSHTIFIIDIEDKISKIKSKIKLCDLAGSERFNSSITYNKQHIFEMRCINKSLFVLGNIIHLLASKKKTHKFIPYKDSKLTQILEDSLSGNSRIYLIATISPKNDSFNETINTLKFADRAHEVMTVVAPNEITSEDIFDEENKNQINKLYKEISGLKQLLLLREKRGNLNTLQAEFLKLKKENSQLKKYIGGENNINMFEKLIKENNNLKKEIKELKTQNNLLKSEESIFFNKNNNIDYNGMISEVKKKTIKNSLSDYNIFNNYGKKNKMRNNNSTRLINTGNNIVNKNNIENGIINNKIINKINLSQIYKNENENIIFNTRNKKRFKSIKSNYNLNYNKINLANLGIKTKFYKNKNIMESLKRLKMIDDLIKKK